MSVSKQMPNQTETASNLALMRDDVICGLIHLRGKQRYRLGEGDAALAVVEIQEADLAVLGGNECAVRLEIWSTRVRVGVPDCEVGRKCLAPLPTPERAAGDGSPA